MTLDEFRSLNEVEQANAVWEGVFIEVRKDNDGSVALYDLGGFYVEVYYSNSDNKITSLRPFKSTELLQPYLIGLKLMI